ncbi:MAG: hypothetical protein HYW88_01055 [Candidatus Sungbacteria bacterium]|nr:hypothetical protein [Candidatus Sungbacteria bacterium]
MSGDFKKIVSDYLEKDSASKYVLAKEFEVATVTVERWANGVSEPNSTLRGLVIRFIAVQSGE